MSVIMADPWGISPWSDDPTFDAAFTDTFNLVSMGPLTSRHPDTSANRPIFNLLRNWIQEGWMNLAPGAGPPNWLSSPTGPFPPFTHPWSWTARFPFEGPSPDEWSVDYTPWPGAQEGLIEPVIGDGNQGALAGVFADAVVGRGYWLTVDHHVHILVRDDTASDPPVPGWKLGFSPLDAATMGMAWWAMKSAIANRTDWTAYLARFHPARATVTDPTAAMRVVTAERSTSVPTDVIGVLQAWTNSGSQTPLGGNGGSIYLFEDPGLDAGGASYAPARTIRFAAGRIRGSSGSMALLQAAALSHWANRTYSMPAFPLVSQSDLERAARTIASAAGILAHELLHLVWRVAFDYAGPWQDDTNGINGCFGPLVTTENALMTRTFLDSDTAESLLTPTPVAVLQQDRSPAGAPPAVRHYTNAVLHRWVQGLLRNDIDNRMAHQDELWCNGSSQSPPCPSYQALHGC